MVECKCCGQLIMLPDTAERRDVWNGKRYVSLFFCNQKHLIDWYLKQLYTLGM